MFAAPLEGVTINGTYKAFYGSALATQAIATVAQDNDMGLVDQADGSELDAGYGIISNGVLYLFLAGNIDSGGLGNNFGGVPFDKLHVFLMTGPGGDNPLGTNYSRNADFGFINRMGAGGNGQDSGSAGLTFDAGFAPNYWIGVTVGGGGTNPIMYANFEVICSNCPGWYMGSTSPGNALVDSSGHNTGIQVALNNSNTSGVWGDPNGCYMNGSPTNVPQNVTTGVEMAIPLSAIGSPSSSIRVCAFITDSRCDSLYNQVLGPVWDGTTGFCEFALSGDGDSSEVNFQFLPGTHYFTVPVPSCESIPASPTTASFPTTGGGSSVFVTPGGGCSWAASVNTNWLTITAGSSGTGSGTITYSVSTNTSINPRTASMFIVGTTVLSTQTVSITQSGVPAPPLGSIIINGTANTSLYGCPLAVQQVGTAFGKNTSADPAAANGSELDAAYGMVQNGVLFLAFAGNLEANYNKLEIFFQTGPGGQHTLTNINPNVDFNGLNRMGYNGGSASNGNPGLTFDADFAPNYWIGVTGGGTPYTFYANYAQLWPGGGGTNGYYLGSTTAASNTLVLGAANPFGVQATVNNMNIAGVDSSACYDDPSVFQQGSVTNGIELGIPLAALGNPTGTVKVCAFVNGIAHDYISNQILGPVNTGTCQGSLGEPTLVNLSSLPGVHYFLVGPEMRVTRAAVTGQDVNISFLTEANTNLSYQLQYTTILTNNTIWTNIGSLNLGNGGIRTVTDGMGATNKPSRFYRVRQTPICP
ncbi:MAG TPA: BACON domain-containing protein [Verrucomicrobiae bacterium]|nr:BACON domain-containing protein [Verrucomicrobiae bacterium]